MEMYLSRTPAAITPLGLVGNPALKAWSNGQMLTMQHGKGGVASSLTLLLTGPANDCSKSNVTLFQGRKALPLRIMVWAIEPRLVVTQLIRAKAFRYITRLCIDVAPLIAQTVFQLWLVHAQQTGSSTVPKLTLQIQVMAIVSQRS